MASSKPVRTHTTSSSAMPSWPAISYTSADSKPSPLVGSSSAPTHGGNAGSPVATVSVPSSFSGSGSHEASSPPSVVSVLPPSVVSDPSSAASTSSPSSPLSSPQAAANRPKASRSAARLRQVFVTMLSSQVNGEHY